MKLEEEVDTDHAPARENDDRRASRCQMHRRDREPD
jgi:hypothetical protein